MSTTPCLLIYGHDAMLLQTRRWLLEGECFRVLSVADLAEVRRLVADEQIDLFVLCHSLSPRESREALTTARAIRPDIKGLFITVDGSSYAEEPQAGVVSCFGGPKVLLTAVRELLARRTAAAI